MNTTAKDDVFTPSRPLIRLSRTACIRCRASKLKCSKKRPGCSRCDQRGLTCQYPDPPDRKYLASQRAPRGSRSEQLNGEFMSVHSQGHYRANLGYDAATHSRPSVAIASPLSAIHEVYVGEQRLHNHAQQVREVSTASSATSMSSDHDSDGKLPALEVGLYLVEIYFSRLFTSSLLFDKANFENDYRAGLIAEYVLLSIFAMASLLFQPNTSSPFSKQNGLIPFAGLNRRARAWAEAASRLVLTHADQPCVSKIQTCEVLGLYWFGVGDLDRVAMHSSISREMCHVLQRKAHFPQRATGSSTVTKLGVPLRTRYACWIKNCLIDSSSSSLRYGTDLSDLANAEPHVVMGTDGDSLLDPSLAHSAADDWLTWDDTNLQSSTIHCIKLLDMWRKVKVLVRSSARAAEYLTCMFELDSNLQKLYRELPTELKTKRLISPNSSERIIQNAFFLRSIYHLCLVYLHASVVPGLSGSKRGLDCSRNVAEYCARTAVISASLFAGIAKDFLGTKPDFSKVPTFVGYCAFIMGSTHAVVLGHSEPKDAFASFANSVYCLLILQELKSYWPIMRLLWLDLKGRINFAQGSRSWLSEAAVHKIIIQAQPSPTQEDCTGVASLSEALFALPSYPQRSFILRSYIPCGDEQENDIVAGIEPVADNTTEMSSSRLTATNNEVSADGVTGVFNNNASIANGSNNRHAFIDSYFGGLHPHGALSANNDGGDLLDNEVNFPDIHPENLHHLWDIFGGAGWDQLYPDLDQQWQ